MPELGPAIAATSSAANAGPAHLGPAIAATSSAADLAAPSPAHLGPAIAVTQSASNDDSFAPAGSHVAAPQAPAAAAMWFAPAAFDAPGTQWFAGLAPGDTFVPALQPSSPGHGAEGVGIAAMQASSVFSTGSGDSWGGAHDGSFAVSELPFTSDNFADATLYTAASDTPWILVADFTGDGWFFV